MPRVVAPLLAVVAAGLVVTAALVPEFEAGGVGVTPLDPDRLGWVPILVGTLVQVGVLLVPAAMLLLGERRGIAGGILLGAGILGVTSRLVRLFQLGEIPDLGPAIGSWVDLTAEAAAILAGALALLAIRPHERDEEATDMDLPPPPGEPSVGNSVQD
jgi:hypothetical protein